MYRDYAFTIHIKGELSNQVKLEATERMMLALSFALKLFREDHYSIDKPLQMVDVASDLMIKYDLSQDFNFVKNAVLEQLIRDHFACTKDEKRKEWLYMVKHPITGHIKIGFTTVPKARISQLQVNCPERLIVIHIGKGTREKEAELHRKFKKQNISGEWFEDTEELRQEVMKVINENNCTNAITAT